jgi:hypothetical protein|eukprot:COSAG06_NODE_2703_length_6428_cov_16.204743_5_plen_215_part_00
MQEQKQGGAEPAAAAGKRAAAEPADDTTTQPQQQRPRLDAGAQGLLQQQLATNAAAEGARGVQYAGRPQLTAEQESDAAKKVFVLGDHANEIVDGLYLGSQDAVALGMAAELRELGVTAVVNCTNDVACAHDAVAADASSDGSAGGSKTGTADPPPPQQQQRLQLKYVRVAVRDEDHERILPFLTGAAVRQANLFSFNVLKTAPRTFTDASVSL